jgi:integrase
MATLLKLYYTRYVDADGRRVKPKTPGARKVRERSTKWFGQYTDAAGRRRRVPLCADKAAARQMLADLERGRTGLVDPYADHRQAPVEKHVVAYTDHLRHKGVSADYLYETIRRLRAVLTACQVRTLAELKVEAVERFLARLADEGASARTRNTYRTSAKAFTAWCLKTRRLGEDVLVRLEAASGEKRRQRRALTEDELGRLLRVARERPLREALLVRRGERKGQLGARVRPEVRAELERLGWERSLMYKTLVCTGLRRGELEQLEVRHLRLDERRPRVVLPGSATKNRQEAGIPLRTDLVNDLRKWIAATGTRGTDRVFRVPKELIKILKRDLELAGIAYRDEHGRTVDVHALRHTTATLLAKAKVSPRIAQQFMRHSDIKLTMQIYTDVRQLDEAEALDAFPELEVNGGVRSTTQGDKPPSEG